MIRIFIILAAFATLGACANPPPISANPAQNVEAAITRGPLGGTIEKGLLDAQYNLNQAQAIGVLAANDPAPKCLNDLLGQAGTPPSPSFVPKISDLISAGSVAYIYARQAEQAAGEAYVNVPLNCKALIGQVVLDGLRAARAGASVAGGPLVGAGVGVLPVLQ